jgi:hypothetical protein
VGAAQGPPATSYHSGKSFTFVHGRPGHPVWAKSRRVTLAVPLSIDRLLGNAPRRRWHFCKCLESKRALGDSNFRPLDS